MYFLLNILMGNRSFKMIFKPIRLVNFYYFINSPTCMASIQSFSRIVGIGAQIPFNDFNIFKGDVRRLQCNNELG